MDQNSPLGNVLSGNTQNDQVASQAGQVTPPGQNQITPTTIDQNSILGKEEAESNQPQIPFNSQAFNAQTAAIKDPHGGSDQSQVGAALDGSSYAGLCQQYVDDQTGAKQRYPTAIATWQAKAQSGQAHQGLDGIAPGDVVEFAPDSSNGGSGHAAIVDGDGNLNMATYGGIKQIPLDTWVKHSGQTPLGYYKP